MTTLLRSENLRSMASGMAKRSEDKRRRYLDDHLDAVFHLMIEADIETNGGKPVRSVEIIRKILARRKKELELT